MNEGLESLRGLERTQTLKITYAMALADFCGIVSVDCWGPLIYDLGELGGENHRTHAE